MWAGVPWGARPCPSRRGQAAAASAAKAGEGYPAQQVRDPSFCFFALRGMRF